MVSRSLRSVACVIALGWEGVGCFLIFRVVIQSPRAQDSFCCPSCVCESNTGGSSAQEVPLGDVSAQFSGEENQEKESFILVIWGFWLSLLLNYLQPGDYVFSDSLRYSPFGMGSVFLATRLPLIPGLPLSLERMSLQSSDWPHGHHPDCGWRLTTAKTTTRR